MIEWIIGIMSVIVSLIGVLLVILQWHKNEIHKRSQIIEPLIRKIREDNKIVNIIYALEHSTDISYKGHFYLNNKNSYLNYVDNVQLEIDIDYTLATLSYICYLYQKKILKKEDMILFEYKIMCCLKNEAIINYLEFIYALAKEFKTETTHKYLIEFGVKKKFLDKEKFEEVKK